MATPRTPGITVLADGRRFIDKRYLGVRIGLRVGAVTQEQAEERLQIEIARAVRPRAKGACAPDLSRAISSSLAVSGALKSSSGMSPCSSPISELSRRSEFMIRRWSP